MKHKLLMENLEKQAKLMGENAELMAELYPDVQHHFELMGAAQITRDWIKGFNSDIVNQ